MTRLLCDLCAESRLTLKQLWRCRHCGVACCDHRATLKTPPNTASCGPCRVRLGQWENPDDDHEPIPR